MSLALDEWAILAAFSQPDNDGAFNGALADYLHGLASRKPVVLFAFAPKAAGTFLRSAAIVAIDGQLRRIVHAQGGRDAQPYLPILIAYYSNAFGNAPLVSHVHMQALPANRRFMEALDLKPVIMLRSIPDMLASYWDMLETDAQARLDGINCTIPPMFPSMSRSDKADFLIEVVGPWYAGYYATWLEYVRQAPERVLLLRYDEFARGPAETLSRVLVHAGVARPLERCQQAIDEIWNERNTHRFNRGETRRGREYFTWRHVDRLARMLSYYPITQELQTELLV
jgi:hypothetical protein